MLTRENRLKQSKSIELVFKNGKRYRSDFFDLRFLENRDNQTRIGFIASGKVFKKAVERSRAKRRIREAVRRIERPFKNSFDLVFSLRKPVLAEDLSLVKKEAEKALIRCGLI